VAVPGGSFTGNSLVWRKVSFPAVTTSKLRVTVTATSDGVVRIMEVEAWGYDTANLNWLVTDQLGTPRMLFDQSGALANVKRHDYLPFGEELSAGIGGRTTTQGYDAADGVRQKFTSKERDNETGLDYFGARYYSSTQGRFTNVDPVTVTPERLFDPQQFNLYAYTRNNPLRFIDPTGKTLTISGDLDEVKKQLAQILGTDDAAKRIKFDEKTNTITVDLTGIDLTKNEGASLLSDAISSNKVHDVKIGTSVDTKGGELSLVPQLKNGGVQNDSMANLDNNPDVRYTKGDKDKPKNGVDDQIAFNYDWRDKHSESNTKLKLAPNWTTTFHELAEAYAKVDGSMQYAQAHQKAIDRETKLRDQRPYLKDYNPGSGPGTNTIIKQ
jgi:RHS repeat-associated protein